MDDDDDTESQIKRCLEQHGIEWTQDLVDDLYKIAGDLASAAESSAAYAHAYGP